MKMQNGMNSQRRCAIRAINHILVLVCLQSSLVVVDVNINYSSLREVLEYHPEMRKLGSLLPIDLSLSMPIDLSLSMPMTPPPGIDVDDENSDSDSSDGNDAVVIGTENGGGSSGGEAGQGGANTGGQNNDLVSGIFSTIRSGNAGGNGLGLGKTGQTGLVLFIAIGGLVVMALIVDQKRRAAAATAAASMSDGVGGAYYNDDNSTVSGESIAVGNTTDRFV
jgi:hypothetical protein